nr:TIGR03943 family protein [Amycolatopsis sp. SID8362]
MLLLLGGALIKIAVDGSYLRYVKPAQQPWLILSGAAMAALAVAAITRDIRTARRVEPHPATEHDGHAHRTRSTWMLILPVLAIFLIAPPALGADSVNRSDGRVISQARQVKTSAFAPLASGNPLPLTLTEVVTRAGWDATNSLNGRTVRLTGFVAHNRNVVYLARLVIGCCAADAFPVKVRVTGAGVAALRDDQWVETTGTVRPDTATPANSYTPTFVVDSLKAVQAPQDPYEY